MGFDVARAFGDASSSSEEREMTGCAFDTLLFDALCCEGEVSNRVAS